MNRHIAYFGLAALMFSPLSFADEVAADDTVTVVEEGESATDVASQIVLPDAASDAAREHAAFGLGVANQAREMGSAYGQQMAEQAREQRADARGGNAGSHPGKP